MQTAESTTSFTKRNIKTQVIMVNDNQTQVIMIMIMIMIIKTRGDNHGDNGAAYDGVGLGQG